MTEINKKFKITSKLLKKEQKVELNEDGTLSLKGIASTTNKDLYGDRIHENCIEKMKEKASTLNIHADHIYDLNDVIGTITNVIPTDENSLAIEFNIIPSLAGKVKELLDSGVKLGLSIGGSVKDYKAIYTETGEMEGWEILDIDLYEISLTPLPANWDTYGTVTKKGIIKANSIAGACEIMRKKENQNKSLKEEVKNIIKEMEDENKNYIETEKEITEESVIKIFNEMSETLKLEIIENIKDEVKKELERFKEELLKEVKERIEREETKEEKLLLDEIKNLNKDLKETLNENKENYKKDLEKTVEEKFLKKLEESRTPEAKEIKGKKSSQNIIESRTMGRKDLARKMAEKKSTNPFVNLLQELNAE